MKHVLTAIILFIGISTFGQIKIEGVVKDSIGNPLELANVIAINQETNKLDSYGITNDQGRYKLALEKNTSYKVQVSYIGMKTAEVTVTTKEESVTRDFILENDNTLDEVELIYEMPVTVKGDTLIYNADSFNTGTERKLEDVLKNLPGVEINADGQVEVEGKVVDKVINLLFLTSLISFFISSFLLRSNFFKASLSKYEFVVSRVAFRFCIIL